MRRLPHLIALATLVTFAACADDELTISPIDDQQVFVGEFLRVGFTVRNAGTPDYRVTYSGPDLPFLDRWAFAVRRPDGGEFQWSPTADHVGVHDFTINVDTGELRASRTFEVEVIAAREASPVFVDPGPGDAFDLTVDPCIDVPIEVRDRDTPEPEVRVVYGMPEGAELELEGRGLARLRWCPSPDQAAAAEQWLITFEADDGDHDPVLHDYRLLLFGERKEDCGGEAPVVEFIEPRDGDDIISRVGYDVRIRVTDDRPLRDRPILFYTDGRLEQRDQIELDQLSFAPFLPEGDDIWTAYIPTFRLAEDEAKTLALVPWVSDDDDPNGTRCDNRAELRIRRFTAIGAVEAGILNVCDRCLVSGDCISGVCLRTAFGGRCVPDCSRDSPDCGVGECRPWSSMEGVVRFGCGAPEFVCLGETPCAPDASEPNDARDDATLLETGRSTSGVACERDDDWFRVPIDADARVRLSLASQSEFGNAEMQLVREDGTIVAVGAVDGSVSVVETCAGASADLYARVFAPGLERIAYTLDLETMAEDCACDDDGAEPDSQGSPRDAAPSQDGTICGTDADFFELEGRPESRTTITLGIDGEGDLDMDLLDPDGELVASSRGVDASETMVIDLPSEGPYLLRVFSYDGRDADYELTVTRDALDVCASSRECDVAESCTGGLCRRLPCVRNADCPVGSICPLVDRVDTARTCLEVCEADAACREGERCKDFFEGRACYATGAAITGAPCTNTSECAANRVCVDWPDGHCAAAGCERGEDVCGSDSSCAVVDGRATCVETCWVSDDECVRGAEYACGELFAPDDELVFGCSPATR